MSEDEPTGAGAARRAIGSRLAKLRVDAHITLERAARHAEITRQTLGKIETGQPRVRIKNAFIRALCELCGASMQTEAGLLKLARYTQMKGWYTPFADLIPAGFDMYIGLEEDADRIMTYEAVLVPGLLQTEGYARAMIATVPGRDPSETERRVKVRMHRQKIIRRESPEPARLDVVINEAALHRVVGGPAVMVAQLRHINDLGTLSNVSIRVLPFDTPSFADLQVGPFVVLEFPPGGGSPIAYLDGFVKVHGPSFYDKESEIEEYTTAFAEIHKDALDEHESSTLIARLARGFEDRA